MSGRKKIREMRENGSGRIWGIWNSIKKEFQFGIKAKSPELAEEMLFKKIGWDAAKYRFSAEAYPNETEKALGLWYGLRYGHIGPLIPEERLKKLVREGRYKPPRSQKVIFMTTISLHLVALLEEASWSHEAENISFRIDKSYSGRFMYGETCLGFCLERNADWLDIFDMFENVNPYLFEIVKRELRELKECARTDSMGLDKIFYFPGHQFPKTFTDKEA